jgi:hypothetical protein
VDNSGSHEIFVEAHIAKKIIDRYLRYDEIKRLLVKLVQHPSPQTEHLETEPQVLALISDVIKPELEEAGLHPSIDQRGNLVLRLNARGQRDRLMRNCRRRILRVRGRMRLGPGGL